jgi:hypothetical protein
VLTFYRDWAENMSNEVNKLKCRTYFYSSDYCMKGQNSNGQIFICVQTTDVSGTDGITPLF